jgi:hypothetical protein
MMIWLFFEIGKLLKVIAAKNLNSDSFGPKGSINYVENIKRSFPKNNLKFAQNPYAFPLRFSLCNEATLSLFSTPAVHGDIYAQNMRFWYLGKY